ncbi:MAG TPA: hypothetical protein VFK52_05765 [Nocardioidaceae bacterium]|nr:hypothetical protein [Nocardioidaceae bacterium]
MRKRNKVALVGVAVVVSAGVGTGFAVASSDDDASERPITGTALQRASEAALAHTNGGRVTSTEVDDEESLYEVEVTLPDGSQVDVQLDEDFQVVGSQDDVEDD